MKRRVLGLLLVLLALWPLAHFALAHRYDMAVGKMGSLGVFARPRMGSRVLVAELLPEGKARVLNPHKYAIEEYKRIEWFAERRHALGTLVSLDSLGRDLLEMHPEWLGAMVTMSVARIDPATGYQVEKVTSAKLWRYGDEVKAEPPPDTPAGPATDADDV